jgi:PAS domain S-box-containing protein
MFARSGVGVARVTRDGRFIDTNQALCRMLGYGKKELLDTTLQAITHPEDRPREEALQSSLERGSTRSYTIEKRYIGNGGIVLWVTETSSAVKDVEGSILYRICLIQLNERRRAQEYFQLALEAVSSGILLVNRKGVILFANTHSEALLGYDRRELLGRHFELLGFSGLTQREFRRHLSARLHSPSELTWCSVGRRKDGTHFLAELGLTPIHTQMGTWFLISLADATHEHGLHVDQPQLASDVGINDDSPLSCTRVFRECH